jgi:hypothetical protein
MSALPDSEYLNQGDTKSKNRQNLADDAVQRCMRIVANVNRFKQPRLEKVQLYRDLYAGKVKRKYRQPFNVVLPVFSGLIDTLQAQFNDDLALEFEEQEPADLSCSPQAQCAMEHGGDMATRRW